MIQTETISAPRAYAQALQQVMAGTRMAELQTLLLTHGVEYVGAHKPNDVKWGRKQECFRNAFILATKRPDLTYVEGYGAWHIATYHAWCVDAEGRVVDPTWRVPKASAPTIQYLGLRLKTAWVIEVVLAAKQYGVFTTGRIVTDPMEVWAA